MPKTLSILTSSLIVVSALFGADSRDVVYRTKDTPTRFKAVVVAPLKQTKNDLNLNTFFPVRHIYFNGLHRFQLADKFSLDDKVEIIRAIVNNLSAKEAVALRVEPYVLRKDLVVSFRVMPPEVMPQPTLVIVSNAHARTGLIIESQSEMSNAAASAYHIRGDRLVEELSTRRKASSITDKRERAHFYLYDELPENDSRIEPLLREVESNAGNNGRKAAAYMSLIEYHLSRGDETKARATLARWEALTKKASEEKKAEVTEFYAVASDLIEIMNRLGKR